MSVKSFLGKPRVPDYQHIHRVNEPRLRCPIPAINVQLENANQTLDKVVYTMNRGGSNARNPLLKGLGTRMVFHVGSSDEVLGVWLFRDRANLGNNQKSSLVNLGAGIYGLDHVLGSGLSQAGNKDIGAIKNFLRLHGRGGAFEREFWVKDYEADVIACNGQNALDLDTLEPVPIELSTADAGEDGWIDVTIDFFVRWNDEFQKMHSGGNPYLNPGFLKAYGGSAFVSFFDTDPGEEGEGIECNPVTQAVINDQHTIQIEGTPGTKHVTVRFRSKQDSVYFVDVDIVFEVTTPADPEAPICNPPQVDNNYNIYIPPVPPWEPPFTPDYPNPPYTPDQPTPTTDDPNDIPDICEFPLPAEDPHTPSQAGQPGLGVLTLNGQKPAGGSVALVQIQRWTATPNQYWLGGAEMTLQSTKYANPAVTDIEQNSPLGDPYDAQKKYTIAVDLDADYTAFVCYYIITLYQKNDSGLWKQGSSRLIPGPRWRGMSAIPNPSLGFGPGSCGGVGFPNIADNGSCPV
jgi:hypothetical protein